MKMMTSQSMPADNVVALSSLPLNTTDDSPASVDSTTTVIAHSIIPVGKDNRPDFEACDSSLRPDYGEFADAAARWRDGQSAWFRASPSRVEYLVSVNDNEGRKKTQRGFEWHPLCGGLIPMADTSGEAGDDFGTWAHIQDKTGHDRQIVIPREIAAGSPGDMTKFLSKCGLSYDVTDKDVTRHLARYLHNRPLKEAWRATSRIGWYGTDAFVFPDETIRVEGAQHVVYNSPTSSHRFQHAGDLGEWKANVASPLSDQTMGVFALCTAAAPALLELLNAEGGGFHIRGSSSTGKTTLLKVAGSFWGGGPEGFVRSWRATDNSLESQAAGHNSSLLCLDEMSQVEPGAAGAAAYMLANGQGKGRANRDGNARAIQSWRLIFLSTGEISLSDKIAEDRRGPRAMAGQEVRCIDILADIGSGHGVWDTVPATGAAAFSEGLCEATSQYYGTPGRTFIKKLVDDRHEAERLSAAVTGAFMEKAGVDGDKGQVRRVAQRFALLAAAGELAIKWEILPFKQGDALKANLEVFTRWRSERGDDHNAEERKHVEAIRSFIERHGSSRFQRFDAGRDAGMCRDQAGFIRAKINETGFDADIHYLFSASGWAEATKGLDAKAVRKTLARKGWILGADGNIVANADRGTLTTKVRPAGLPTANFTIVSGSVLEGDSQNVPVASPSEPLNGTLKTI